MVYTTPGWRALADRSFAYFPTLAGTTESLRVRSGEISRQAEASPHPPMTAPHLFEQHRVYSGMPAEQPGDRRSDEERNLDLRERLPEVSEDGRRQDRIPHPVGPSHENPSERCRRVDHGASPVEESG